MSSGPSEQNQQEKQASEAKEGAAENLVETVECPNCGRRFVGDYCPDCGEEVNQSVTVWDVIGGFFRELGDLERGFWPTLVALTLRPGRMLREYLRGAREQFISPGRYLLATGLIGYGVGLIPKWIYPAIESGSSDDPEDFRFQEPEITKTSGEGDDLQLETSFNVGENTDIIFLVMAAVAGAYVWRLFQDEVESLGEGVALALFAGGHAQLIPSILGVFVTPGLHLWGMQDLLTKPMEKMPPGDAALALLFGLVAVLIVLGYFGACFGLCFSGWRDGMKAAVVYAWSFIEVTGALVAASTGYTIFRLWRSPSRYLPESVEVSRLSEAYPGLFSTMAVAALPVLIHFGIELYCRWR